MSQKTTDRVNELHQKLVGVREPFRPAEAPAHGHELAPGRSRAAAQAAAELSRQGSPRGYARPTRRSLGHRFVDDPPVEVRRAQSPRATRTVAAPSPADSAATSSSSGCASASANGPERVRRSAVRCAPGPERTAEIGGQRPHVGPLRAADAQATRLGRRRTQQRRARGSTTRRGVALDRFAGARVVVERPAVTLERRVHGRHLRDRAAKAARARPRPPPRRAPPASARAVTLPSASWVSVSTPKRTVDLVLLVGVQQERRELGRLAQADRQHARGQRIERAAVPDLACTPRRAPHPAHDVERRRARAACRRPGRVVNRRHGRRRHRPSRRSPSRSRFGRGRRLAHLAQQLLDLLRLLEHPVDLERHRRGDLHPQPLPDRVPRSSRCAWLRPCRTRSSACRRRRHAR